MRTEEVAQGRVNGHIAHADRPRGGVLVLPTITGVDATLKQRVQVLAQAGFTSLIWDPYPGEAQPADLAAAGPRASKLSDGNSLESMSECVGYMLGTLRLPAVATLGFCLGGRFAVLLAATDKRLVGCVPYYPSIRIPNPPNQSLDAIALSADIQCPVHLIHGTGDQVFLHAVFLKLRDALDARKAATTVQVHPGAVHSFMRPDLHIVPANADAARLSWPQAMAFLGTCLPAG